MESPRHRRGKTRIFLALLSDPRFSYVGMEVKLPAERQGYPYTADVYAETLRQVSPGVKVMRRIVLEADGKKGHSGILAHRKDGLRTQMIRLKNMIVIRFNLGDLVGKKANTVSQIIEEVDFWLAK